MSQKRSLLVLRKAPCASLLAEGIPCRTRIAALGGFDLDDQIGALIADCFRSQRPENESNCVEGLPDTS